MPYYQKLGLMPRKKHTTFYKEDGSLYREELVSTKGFSGIYSNKYHHNMPTKTLSIKELPPIDLNEWVDVPLMNIHFESDKFTKKGDFFTSRVSFMFNNHVNIFTAKPNENPDYFFKNSYASEFIFVHHGTGKLLTEFGNLMFGPGDQIVIPQGTIYQMIFDNLDNNKLLIIESDTPFEIPKHYHNQYGQLEEHAPYEERDFRGPDEITPIDEKGEFRIIHKAGNRLFEYIQPHHPFDVVGWDGFLYPYIFNIKDYNPKVGRIHLPPPIHLLYTTQHFVICNFNPRPFDWHEQAIPAPYYHANVDSSEMLYYVEGDFMSRTGVGEGSVTIHPLGIPHGPQPGKTEASIGVKETKEYAVMVDTFEPVKVSNSVKEIMQPDYFKSWLE